MMRYPKYLPAPGTEVAAARVVGSEYSDRPYLLREINTGKEIEAFASWDEIRKFAKEHSLTLITCC